ncbi:hypothetical protein KY495_02835 [Massilia sp. PAMC28688]|nr:hypothetical protein KY495_02835 [Massilia sp. PAMC28688]
MRRPRLVAGLICAMLGAPLAARAPDHVQSSLGPPITAGQLATARGTGGVSLSTTLGGAVTGNTASELVTGANTIAGGALAGASGVPVVIQNTGANVLIQNATVINLQLQ